MVNGRKQKQKDPRVMAPDDCQFLLLSKSLQARERALMCDLSQYINASALIEFTLGFHSLTPFLFLAQYCF